MSFLVETTCPFSWKPWSADDGVAEFPLNHLAYTLLEEAGHQSVAGEKDSDSDLQRLEHKLNLVIQMLGQMMHSQQPRPEAVPLRLGAETIAWQNPSAKSGQRYVETQFLYRSITMPIQALVEVIEQDQDWCIARFVSAAPEEQSAWEHWVFRQHRRQIAHARTAVS